MKRPRARLLALAALLAALAAAGALLTRDSATGPSALPWLTDDFRPAPPPPRP